MGKMVCSNQVQFCALHLNNKKNQSGIQIIIEENHKKFSESLQSKEKLLPGIFTDKVSPSSTSILNQSCLLRNIPIGTPLGTTIGIATGPILELQFALISLPSGVLPRGGKFLSASHH